MDTYFKYFCIVVALTTVLGCSKKKEPKEKPLPSAKVQNAVKETDLTTITLTVEAESRLGVQTVTVENRSVEKNRTFGGEVVSVSGRSVTVYALLSGMLLPAEDGLTITAGKKVSNGQPLYRLLSVLPGKDLLSVQEEISHRKIELDLAKSKVERARQLFEDKAVSAKDLEEAEAELASIMASLETAVTRMKLLNKGELDSAADGLSSLIIQSPVDGIIQKIHVAPGQMVTSATALLEVVDIDPIWIKVPVYVGDLTTIDIKKPARVHSLADLTGSETQAAESVTAPFTADPDSVTADIFYELPNTDFSYRPGQKVSVTLSLKETEKSLVVPYSSILYDMYGGVWVYENTEPGVYVRQRVELHYVLDELAVLSRGPVVGAEVVSEGAAELFGIEFGVGK